MFRSASKKARRKISDARSMRPKDPPPRLGFATTAFYDSRRP